jgi:hypothetical protein
MPCGVATASPQDVLEYVKTLANSFVAYGATTSFMENYVLLKHIQTSWEKEKALTTSREGEDGMKKRSWSGYQTAHKDSFQICIAYNLFRQSFVSTCSLSSFCSSWCHAMSHAPFRFESSTCARFFCLFHRSGWTVTSRDGSAPMLSSRRRAHSITP